MKSRGNTILITGGSSGIGRALAEAFHQLGNQVIISGRTQKTLDEVIALNSGMKAYTVDMTDAASIQRLATAVVKDFPQLNVVINNAGMMKNENILNDNGDIIEATIATNLLGPIRLTSALLTTLMKNEQPVVMTVSSGLAFVPLSMTPTYSATKAAIHSYTQSLRYQLKDTRVAVVEIIPPYVATTLMGDRQANDPNAMPLNDFITETLQLLTQEPALNEICVERVGMLRNAAHNGPQAYEKTFTSFNDHMTAVRKDEMPQLV